MFIQGYFFVGQTLVIYLDPNMQVSENRTTSINIIKPIKLGQQPRQPSISSEFKENNRADSNRPHALTNLLLYESQYVPYKFNNQQMSENYAIYYHDNTLNANQKFSENQSEISQDSLCVLIMKLSHILEAEIKQELNQGFEAIKKVPKNKIHDQIVFQGYRNEQQIQLVLSQDQDQQPSSKITQQSSQLCLQQGSKITFGRQSNQQLPITFNHSIKKKYHQFSVNQLKPIQIQRKLKAYPKDFHIKNQQPIDSIVNRLPFTLSKMQHLSKLPYDIMISVSPDDNNYSLINTINIEENKTQQQIHNESVQTSNIEKTESSIINKIIEGPTDDYNSFVKRIKGSIIVVEPRSPSFLQQQPTTIQQKPTTPKTRPISNYYSPHTKIQHKIQNPNIVPQTVTEYGFQQNIKNPGCQQHPSILSKQTSTMIQQLHIDNKVRHQEHQDNKYLNNYEQKTTYFTPRSNYELNGIHNRQNGSDGVFNIGRPQYFSPITKIPERSGCMRIQSNTKNQNASKIYHNANRSNSGSVRSAPSSPMINRNLKGIQVDGTQKTHQFKRTNPQSRYSQHESLTEKSHQNIPKPHSYYLGHLQQPTPPSHIQNNLIQQEYYDCDTKYKNNQTTKKKINIVTNMEQLIQKKKKKVGK